jgi:hypothetical protein
MPEQHAIGEIISNVVRVGSNCYMYMNECVVGCVAVVHGSCLAAVYVQTCMRTSEQAIKLLQPSCTSELFMFPNGFLQPGLS